MKVVENNIDLNEKSVEFVDVVGNDLEEMVCNYNCCEKLNYDIWMNGGIYKKNNDGSIVFISDVVEIEFSL